MRKDMSFKLLSLQNERGLTVMHRNLVKSRNGFKYTKHGKISKSQSC